MNEKTPLSETEAILVNLRDKTLDMSRKFKEEHSSLQDPFAMISNGAKQEQEIVFGYYLPIWERAEKRTIKGPDYERVARLNMWLLIQTMSLVEFCIKSWIENSTGDLSVWYAQAKQERNAKWVSLVRVIKKSAKLKKPAMTEGESDSWMGIIELRNCLVHNNAISSITRTYSIGNTTIAMEKGRNVGGGANYLIEVVFSFIELLDRWQQWFFREHNVVTDTA